MKKSHLDFFKLLEKELNQEQICEKFLGLLLEMQNVERGSIWIRQGDEYVCVHAAGGESEKIRGCSINDKRPSIVGWVMEHRKMTVAECGVDTRHYKELEQNLDVKSSLLLAFPMFMRNGEIYGVVEIIDTSAGGNRLNLQPDYLELLQDLIDLGSVVLGTSLAYNDKILENQALKKTLEAISGEEMVFGTGSVYQEVVKKIASYAKTDYPVLITGESGTGKEVVARALHRQSRGANKPFLAQNCAAIPGTLLESELFGYKKGAFTGATKDKTGLFEAASGGTVFLDEIGDMPPDLQTALLRVLERNEVKPLGSTETIRIDVRIISATNVDLKEAIAEKKFREDLFYRLNVLPLHVPPLRDRADDIHLLLSHFMLKEASRLGLAPKRFSPQAMNILRNYPWRGNVRELINFVKQILILTDKDVVGAEDLPADISADIPEAGEAPAATHLEYQAAGQDKSGKSGDGDKSFFAGYTFAGLEKDYFLYLLEHHRWNVTLAAKSAALNRTTFDSRMKKLGIRKRA